MRPFDNLHAAWCMGVEHERYASAGCQVIVGYPQCTKRENQPDTGPWGVFKANAYKLKNQNAFVYILLNGRDAQKAALGSGKKSSVRLRFGSKGSLVEKLQQRLQKSNFYEGKIDGDFGQRTLFAVLNFQTTKFDSSSDDGIVGPVTASALDLKLSEES